MNQSIRVTGKTYSDFLRHLKSKEMHLRKAGVKFTVQKGYAYTPVHNKERKVIRKKDYETFIFILDD